MTENIVATIDKGNNQVCEFTCTDFDMNDANAERKYFRVDFEALTVAEKQTVTDALVLIKSKKIEVI